MRPILQAPHDGLRTVCAPVTSFDAALQSLADDMFDTMYAAPGRGLAAPQVGVLSRLFVMDVIWKDADPSPVVCVNPRVLDRSVQRVAMDETCLSIAGVTIAVSRPAEVRLRWQDLNGAVHERGFDGVAAAIVQHESDHLDGVLITDDTGRP
ncbi:peptide deformylase [Loktanella sp. SALINAS62]|uniref:peptide deformylase n=1 Tax=Loktanella sp. SALINAS62 TaxID=2706124 RepID=UPI001B8B31AB|nr:peptide deformylase [Loktanella sp. SALINAS62]MBS1300896.1 peptide deformylase [Loktanella sp. SALINAS62]